VAKVAN